MSIRTNTLIIRPQFANNFSRIRPIPGGEAARPRIEAGKRVKDKTFNEPRIALNRIYTRLGDHGSTSLTGGQRTGKDDLRIEAYGTVDELNAFLGCARVTLDHLAPEFPTLERLSAIVHRVQHELFNLGSILSTLPADVQPRQPRVTSAEVKRLEAEIDVLNADLPALRSFVLPGGSRLNAEMHLCRTVCRRAERLVVALSRREDVDDDCLHYLNRLSDAMFVWSRWVNWALGAEEVLWDPNQASGASAP